MRRLSRQDLLDILNGAAVLGAGGGGDIGEGIDLIDTAFAAGKNFDLVALDDVPDDALICTPYLLGAISDLRPEEEALYVDLDGSDKHPLLIAYEQFQNHLGQEFYGTTPCELGGSNTAAAFFPAAMHGHVIIDADPAGRAVPEITHSTYYLHNLPAAPVFAANEFGETFVLDGVKDDKRAEVLVRALCSVSRHDISAIDHALPMHRLRDVLIKGTITKSLELGRAMRVAQDNQANVAHVVAEMAGGFVAFEGVVTQSTYETVGGFTLGQIEAKSAHSDTLRIDVKNENLVAWINDAVYATIPDLICVFDKDTGKQISNPDVQVGTQMSMVLLPAPDVWRTDKGLAAFGPRYAGLQERYRWPGP